MRVRNILYIFIGTVLALSIPLVAMQFSDEVNWSYGDFLVMGTLLITVGFFYEFVIRRMKKHKVVAVIILLLAFLFIWAELAVGVFTNIGS